MERKRLQGEALQGARERFGALKGEADALEARTREFRREHAELPERLHRHELEHAEGEAEMRLLSERIRNEYEVDLASWIPPAPAAEGPPGRGSSASRLADRPGLSPEPAGRGGAPVLPRPAEGR